MTYGFRLYKATHAHETGYTAKPWVTDDFDFAKHLLKSMSGLYQSPSQRPDGTDGDWPDPHPAYLGVRDIASLDGQMAADMATGNVVGRVEEVERNNDHRITMTVCVGRVGAFDRALGRRDDPLKDRAASRSYRATLVFPRIGSAAGLLGVEAIGRTAPSGPLSTLIALASRYRSFTTSKPWHRLTLEQATDGAFLQEVLAGQEASVVLTRSTVDGAGDRKKTDMRLDARVHATQLHGLTEWLGLEVSKRRMAGISGMLSIVGGEETLDDVGFDDGFVKIGDGQTSTKIRLYDNLKDTFTYPITEDVRPTDQAWDQAVRDRMQIVDPDLAWD